MADNGKSFLKELKTMFDSDETVSFRDFSCKKAPLINFCVVFVNGMIDKEAINSQIIKPIMDAELNDALDINHLIDKLSKEVLTAAGVAQGSKLEEIIQELLGGSSILFINEFDRVLILDTADWDKRAINEPPTEKVVNGPREGFTENIGTNIVMVRRRLKSANLRLRFRKLGAETQTKICICYLDNVVDKKILEEVERRLDKIDIDSVLDIGYIREIIKDTPLTPFKTTGITERPDVTAAKLLEGRVVIICDGTPMAITVPFLFVEYFNVNEDYYNNFYYATLNRILRWIGFFLASSVPAIYVALVTFHQEMLPTQLLLSISGSQQNVPFPTIVEALLMLFVFEIIRETSIRMPSVIGSTLSIVGALVIGQAAVEAKLVSAPMIIVAALTGITSFVTPRMEGELLIIRLVFLLLAAFMGLYGYIFGVIGMFIHMASLRSFSIPYMMHLASLRPSDAKDVMLRVPWWKMKSRPKLVTQNNRFRTSEGGESRNEDDNEKD